MSGQVSCSQPVWSTFHWTNPSVLWGKSKANNVLLCVLLSGSICNTESFRDKSLKKKRISPLKQLDCDSNLFSNNYSKKLEVVKVGKSFSLLRFTEIILLA